MPFLIKSSGGQRTCKLMSNKNQNTAREDIMEALKGLTFKFEVKIVDVVGSEDETLANGDNQNSTQTVISSSKSNQDKAPAMNNSTKAPEVVQRSCDMPDARFVTPSPDLVPARREETVDRFDDMESISVIQAKPRAQETTPIPPTVEAKNIYEPEKAKEALEFDRPKMTPVDEPKPTTVLHDKAPPVLHTEQESFGKLHNTTKNRTPQQSLIKGSMKAGTVVTTCCVAIDDTDGPGVAVVTYDNKKLLDITKLITDATDNIEDQPEVGQVDYGDIVLAKSQEDESWYRAIVEKYDGSEVLVYFFDWGIRETLSKRRVRRLNQPNLGLSHHPACACKVKFTNTNDRLVEEALKCEEEFQMKIEFYDDTTETYTATVVSV